MEHPAFGEAHPASPRDLLGWIAENADRLKPPVGNALMYGKGT
jgi:hypothetical protein